MNAPYRGPTSAAVPPGGRPEDWAQPTELATQLMGAAGSDESADADIGKTIGPHLRELFVVCEPGEALRQQFDRLARPMMVLHGAGGAAAARALAGIAQTAGWPLKRLVVRRQGFGTTLAELTYLDCPAHDGKLLRLYATEVEADAVVRASLARLLLARASQVVVVLDETADKPAPAVLQGLHGELLAAGGSPAVVVLPLQRSDRLRAALDDFKRRLLPQAQIYPATGQPAQQWALMATAWNRLFQPAGTGTPSPTGAGVAAGSVLLRQINIGPRQGGRPISVGTARPAVPAVPPAPAEVLAAAVPAVVAAPTAPATPSPAAAAARPASVSPAPVPPASVPSASPPAAAPAFAATMPAGLTGDAAAPAAATPMDRYAAALSALPGVRGGAVFEMNTLKVLASLPGSFAADKLALQGRGLVMAAVQAGPVLGLGAAIGELIVSLGSAQLLVRPVPRHAGVLLHLVVDRQADLPALRQGIKTADLLLA